jgi:hypothetical protein
MRQRDLILIGAVQQGTKLELPISLKTVAALHLEFPSSTLLRADNVVE